MSGEDLTPYRRASKAILAVLSRYGPAERLGLDEVRSCYDILHARPLLRKRNTIRQRVSCRSDRLFASLQGLPPSLVRGLFLSCGDVFL